MVHWCVCTLWVSTFYMIWVIPLLARVSHSHFCKLMLNCLISEYVWQWELLFFLIWVAVCLHVWTHVLLGRCKSACEGVRSYSRLHMSDVSRGDLEPYKQENLSRSSPIKGWQFNLMPAHVCISRGVLTCKVLKACADFYYKGLAN